MCGRLQQSAQRGELPRRAGFYGDSRKAATRSGSFSGLISVLSQRRTCVSLPPPSPCPPSPVNPTSMAGHKQPIKPGLASYLHTLSCGEKSFSTHQILSPLPSQTSFHRSHSVVPSIFYFIPNVLVSENVSGPPSYTQKRLRTPPAHCRAPPLTPYADDGCVFVNWCSFKP